jgi:glycosyltransferase involved in cell wall biosynthesis
LAEKDPRISFKFPVPAEKVVEILAEYDLLAVPSQCLETGPLVVLEAFAAGIPVIGSNLGGIAELVKHEVNGLLVEPNSVKAWCQQLQRLCQDTDLRMQLGAGNFSTPANESSYRGDGETLSSHLTGECGCSAWGEVIAHIDSA